MKLRKYALAVASRLTAGKPRLLFYVAALSLLCIMLPGGLRADTVVLSDPFFGSGGDFLFRGFYISSYAGTNLGTVTLAYDTASGAAGTYETSLTANLGAYNGPIIGSTQTVTAAYGTTETLVTYNFGGVPIAPGSLITFTQQVISQPAGGSLFYDVGPCSAFLGVSCTLGVPGVIETDGTSAPLDSFRRDSVGVIITETPEPATLLLLGTGLLGLVGAARRKWLA